MTSVHYSVDGERRGNRRERMRNTKEAEIGEEPDDGEGRRRKRSSSSRRRRDLLFAAAWRQVGGSNSYAEAAVMVPKYVVMILTTVRKMGTSSPHKSAKYTATSAVKGAEEKKK